MKARVLPALAALLVLAACSTPDSPTSPTPSDPSYNRNPNEIQKDPKVHVHLARGQAGRGGGGVKLLQYHSGAVMTGGASVKAIFWGPSWNSSGFVSDKITGLGTFYGGISGTNYMNTNTEYTQADGKHVGTAVSYNGSTTDLSTPANGSQTSAILAEVCKEISNPVSNGYYPVYVDTPRGRAGYCAWHSYGTCGGVPVQIAFFFNLDGDAGCDPGSPYGGHTQGLAALANVSGHELSEAVTDPRNGGWWDSTGAENSDKCAWTFGPSLVAFSNRSSWKIQGNWSNKAYSTRTGYDGAGCISG